MKTREGQTANGERRKGELHKVKVSEKLTDNTCERDEREAELFDRCAKCNRPFIEDETAYYVCELPLGWRDKDTPCFTVCEECYVRYYGWNNLLTRVVVE